MCINVQGEIVDLYLADKNTLMVIISGMMHVGIIFAIIVGAELFINGGWMLTGLGISVSSALPIFLLPFIGRLQQNYRVTSGDAKQTASLAVDGENLKDKPSRIQQVLFYAPDLAVFLNNLAYVFLVYSIPPRIKNFGGKSLRTAVLFTNFITVSSFLSSLVLGFIPDRKRGPTLIMFIGNVLFYIGAIMAFGSTTEFLDFPGFFEIGCLLVGIGDSAVINIAIMSKFSLYQKWEVKAAGLAEHSSAVFNLSMSFSQALGTVLSGMAITRASEIPTIGGALAACVVNVIALTLCMVV